MWKKKNLSPLDDGWYVRPRVRRTKKQILADNENSWKRKLDLVAAVLKDIDTVAKWERIACVRVGTIRKIWDDQEGRDRLYLRPETEQKLAALPRSDEFPLAFSGMEFWKFLRRRELLRQHQGRTTNATATELRANFPKLMAHLGYRKVSPPRGTTVCGRPETVYLRGPDRPLKDVIWFLKTRIWRPLE